MNKKDTNRPQTFPMVAKTFFGAEEILMEELKLLGAINPVKAVRAVLFEGDQRMMYKANLWCRTALRILKPFQKFPALNENQLYDEVKKINWQEIISADDTIAIDSVSRNSNLNHTKYISQKIKDAIADQFRERSGRRPSVDLAHPTLRLNAHIYNNECSLSFDSSGESLHKRGYRDQTNEAPLNETLAAGLVLLSGWDGKSNFVDFMCGSGTILIEAAMIAKNIAPGIFRNEFGFQRWKDFDAELWEDILDETKKSEIKKLNFKIYGNDISSFTLRQAKENITYARMLDDIRLSSGIFEIFSPPPAPGTVIINPPYGGRLGDSNIEMLYKQIGDCLKKNFKGYTAWILTANQDAAKKIGLHPSKKIPLFNGSLECRFLKYELYEGSKKKKSEPAN